VELSLYLAKYRAMKTYPVNMWGWRYSSTHS